VHLKRYPVLPDQPPRHREPMRARDVMSSTVKTVREVERVDTLVGLLRTTNHHGFPVTAASDTPYAAPGSGPGAAPESPRIPGQGRVLGIILRDQLCTLLNKRVFANGQGGQGPQPAQLSADDFMRPWFSAVTIDELGLTPEDMSSTVDLRPYVNEAALVTLQNTSLRRVNRLFRTMGLRHLLVIESCPRVVGIITRKDVIYGGDTARDTSSPVARRNGQPAGAIAGRASAVRLAVNSGNSVRSVTHGECAEEDVTSEYGYDSDEEGGGDPEDEDEDEDDPLRWRESGGISSHGSTDWRGGISAGRKFLRRVMHTSRARSQLTSVLNLRRACSSAALGDMGSAAQPQDGSGGDYARMRAFANSRSLSSPLLYDPNSQTCDIPQAPSTAPRTAHRVGVAANGTPLVGCAADVDDGAVDSASRAHIAVAVDVTTDGSAQTLRAPGPGSGEEPSDRVPRGCGGGGGAALRQQGVGACVDDGGAFAAIRQAADYPNTAAPDAPAGAPTPPASQS